MITILNTKSLLVKRLTGKYHLLYNKMKPLAAKRRRANWKSSLNSCGAPCWLPTTSPPHMAQTEAKRSVQLNKRELFYFVILQCLVTEPVDAVSKGRNVTIGSWAPPHIWVWHVQGRALANPKHRRADSGSKWHHRRAAAAAPPLWAGFGSVLVQEVERARPPLFRSVDGINSVLLTHVRHEMTTKKEK